MLLFFVVFWWVDLGLWVVEHRMVLRYKTVGRAALRFKAAVGTVLRFKTAGRTALRFKAGTVLRFMAVCGAVLRFKTAGRG